MGCPGGCPDANFSGKTSNHSPKKMPDWGMKSTRSSKKSFSNNSGSFGNPRVRMSFSGKSRRGY